ncbi:bifunctional precorrin-2 dehydrogenase/sirohydrochlorin ferrochelatase [Paenibacillus sp. 7541]|uniref:precorrin-2 dehydrogenase/sirohydrochlorin ferrochelatase family protein n=1 Tax=Paenibacillus sp. 7541 TaxID=2026236 RepID=UPI000BA51F4A|nr:NAD(P)-dependent oxidoreductase [Paenibacillus sp. 7541]PAK48090.1 siroheme synthase [Paenibacillus sp. 7541]
MAYELPVMLNCEGRLCLIIGGGKVAERKASALREAGARLCVISPLLKSARLAGWADDGSIEWKARAYREGDLNGAFLVHAATDAPDVNAKIAADADRLGILVNVASEGSSGSFTNPAVLRRGRLTVAIATSGAGPMASVTIKEQLEHQFGEEYEAYLDFLYRMRTAIKDEVELPEQRRCLLHKLYRLDILEEIRRGDNANAPWDPDKIKQWIEQNREE